MAKVTEIVIAYVELGASQEDMRNPDYAQRVIDRLSNFKFLELIGDAIDWADSMSSEELENRGWS